jgi:hypothetical protein
MVITFRDDLNQDKHHRVFLEIDLN